MKAGRLRDRIRIEEFTTVVDQTGAPTKTWTPVVERQAAITFVSGREYFDAGQDVSENVVRIFIREVPELRLDAMLRAIDVDRGDTFDVTAILPTGFRNDVTLVCKTGGSKEA